MIRTAFVGLSLVVAAGLAAAPAAAATLPANDYADGANWLCRPNRADACSAPLTVTAVAADGTLTSRPVPVRRDTAPVDCFYVYPTVSTDPGGNSDMTADRAETNVATIQFAPFREVCRTFAPLYRQVTLSALRAVLTGQPTTADRILAFGDVVDAWRSYLARDNQGRGVILIGHSQGSGILKALIAREIEGKPVAARMIAAYIPGNNVEVPTGKDVGGDFKSTSLCRAATQIGCVVAYVSFRDAPPPPADTRFGRTATPGMAVACTNPAALGGGRATLTPLLPNRGGVVDNGSAQAPWLKGKTVSGDFVALPGLLSAECRDAAGASVLAIRTDADPADPRTDSIGGDVVVGGAIDARWGLHLIDVNAATGNLVDLARSQAAAWRKLH